MITLILGGTRSGKSNFALDLAKKHKRVSFVATCQGLDKEMITRIMLHREKRPRHWKTFEEPRELVKVLKQAAQGSDCIIIDCLTLLVSNLLLSGNKQAAIEKKLQEIISCISEFKKKWVIIVSNEVGLGIVPQTKTGRDFRDIAGRVNQLVAAKSDQVFFMFSGMALRIK